MSTQIVRVEREGECEVEPVSKGLGEVAREEDKTKAIAAVYRPDLDDPLNGRFISSEERLTEEG